MTISYSLAPNPKWYFADLTGRPLGAGSMFTYSSLNKVDFKPVFQDPGGNFPWTDPILIDENGTQGPFYFEFDSSNPDDTYYIEVYDVNGVLQWTIDNFFPPSSGGGSVVTAVSLQNLIINNVFWRNLGTSQTPLPTDLVLAPGCHAGFSTVEGGSLPDIRFQKNNTNAVDQITFEQFILGSNPLIGDVTPQYFLNYACTNTPSSEVYKYVQFPITSQIENLSNQTVTFTVWARGNSGTVTLIPSWYQFFGDGSGATSPITTPIETLNLTSGWVKYIVTTSVPDVSTDVIGACGNSALYLQMYYPLGASCNIDFTLPSIFLGNISPQANFQLNDEIDAVVNAPRTGDIRTSINKFQPFGWVVMNDGTIGSASSGATTRANVDTFPLFDLIWNYVGNSLAQLYDSSGNPVSRGSTSTADYEANTQLSLTKMLGRVMAGTSAVGPTTQVFTADSVTETLTVSSTNQFFPGVPVIFTTTGTLPTGLHPNQTYYVLSPTATTLQVSATPFGAVVAFSTNGTGTNSITVPPYALGSYSGDETHTLSVSELASHSHAAPAGNNFLVSGTGSSSLAAGPGQALETPNPTSATGSSTPFSILQPTVYYNIFVKL